METNRLDNRLTEEIAKLNNRITEEVAKLEKRITEEVLKLEKLIAEEVGKLRVEMTSYKTEIIKWMFIFWIGQVTVIAALFKLLK